MPRLFPPGPRRYQATFLPVMLATLSFLASVVPAAADDGYATWYGPGFQGNVMYDGQIYDMYDPTTTACNIYPLGTWVKVTNPHNGASVIVQVRDRGAFHHAFDLSYAAFKRLANPDVMEIAVTYQVVSGPSGDPPPARATVPASPAPPVATPAPSPTPAPATRYVVQLGDNLADIAARFGVSARILAGWNGIVNPNLVTPGQTLRLTAPPSPPPPAAPSPTPSASPRSAGYIVLPGDTLSSIADRFGLSNAQIVAANNLANPDDIVIGQSLVIPGQARPASRHYVVRDGDSLSDIATSLGVTVTSLVSANQISDPNLVQPGQQLIVPGQ
jgi:LysM repeat protein